MSPISRGLLESLAARGRTTTLLLAAVLLGGIGGAWAVAGAPGLGPVTVSTVADGSGSPSSTEATGRPTDAGRPSDAGKPDKPGKPAKTGAPGAEADEAEESEESDKAQKTDKPDGAQGVHGRCVSAVARSSATAGPNDNHGGAVSAAAKDCPRPSPATTDD